MTFTPGFKDIKGQDIELGDILKFEFKDLLDSPFSNGNFGSLLAKQSIDECYIHIHNAKDVYPDGGWYNCLYYFIYLVKNGRLFINKMEDNAEYVLKDSDRPFFTSDSNPDFLRYLINKERLVVFKNNPSKNLAITDLIN